LLQKNYSPAVVDVINRTAKLINGADEVISDYVADNLDSILVQSSNEKFEVKINLLKTFNEFIQGELIQAAVKKYFRFELGTMNKIDRILSLMDATSGAIYELNSNYFVLKDREYLIFTKNEVDEEDNVLVEGEGEYSLGKTTINLTFVNKRQIRYKKDSNIEFIAADDLPPMLELRKWQTGDKFQPLGMRGTINMSDFLTNNKISLIDKQSITVLTNKVDIIWVPGMRIADKFKIQTSTKKVLKAEVIENPLNKG
jgi:tRNA(Ile)-lysidine synthase